MTAAPVNPRIPQHIHDWLISEGWYKVRGRLYGKKNEGNLVVTDGFIELIDRLYLKGFKHGLERGCYETETKEDA